MAKKDETVVAATTYSTYGKEQLLQSKRYAEKRDLLAVLLEDGKLYYHSDVEKLIKDFTERKVKLT